MTDPFNMTGTNPVAPVTRLQAEAALCLYEAMIDARLQSTLPALEAAWDAAGSHTMRGYAIELAPFAVQVWDASPSLHGAVAYDFEFIPALLATLQWAHAGYVRPSVAEAVEAVAEALSQ